MVVAILFSICLTRANYQIFGHCGIRLAIIDRKLPKWKLPLPCIGFKFMEAIFAFLMVKDDRAAKN